jgi:hypothetical protein
MKLVNPAVAVKIAPNHLGGGAASALGGNKRRCARNNNVKTPTMPATVDESNTLNSKVPITVPTKADGNKNFNNCLSKSFLYAEIPSKSITNKTGINIAAACGTVTAIAIIGTAKDPNPDPKPLLLTPSNKTAGIATA